jgi:protein ImuB
MFAAIFIPDFPVQALLRAQPELRSRPLAVLAGRPPLEKVMALNESARQVGVETGATKSQLEAWENLVLRSRSQPLESAAHGALLNCAQSFSPEIEDTAPGTVLLNLAGLQPLLGSLPKITQNLARSLSHIGLEANLAVASNPDAALLAAHGFPGVTVIPPGCEAQQLGGLLVDVLLESFSSDADEATRWIETFDRWGIRTLRSLAALPEVPVIARLGQQGLRLQKLARGAASRNLHVLEPPMIFADSVDLEYPIILLEPLAFLLHGMLEQVCGQLRERALAVQELSLTLELNDNEPDQCASLDRISNGTPTKTFTRTLQLPTPMLDTKVFLKLLQLDLQAHPPGAPIVKIHLSVQPARPRALQSGLFQPLFPEPEKLELTLARIAGIVGEGRVGAAELLDTHREGAFAVRHFAPAELIAIHSNHTPEVAMRKNNNASDLAELEENAKDKMSAVIALRLFRPPLAAIISLREAKPVQVRCPQRQDLAGEIIWTAGPWRSSGDWSEQEGWSREEWDIAVSANTGLMLYRLVQDRLSGNWFVEGTYD